MKNLTELRTKTLTAEVIFDLMASILTFTLLFYLWIFFTKKTKL